MTHYTRKQYMNKECTHKQFYEQWVTLDMVDYVVGEMGAERLLSSTDEHLNDINLNLWDRLYVMHYVDKDKWIDSRLSVLNTDVHENNRIAHEKRSFSYSMSDSVCVAKAAARVFIEQNKG